MCWIGYKTDKKIASEDIKCRKIINHNLVSKLYEPYYRSLGMCYVLGKTYTSKTLSPRPTYLKSERIRLHAGFHSYSMKVLITCPEETSEVGYVYEYEARVGSDKVHFWKTNVRVPVIVECTIPKGSTYYENQYGEIVSDSIRIDRKITL